MQTKPGIEQFVSVKFEDAQIGSTIIYETSGQQHLTYFLSSQLDDIIARSKAWYSAVATVRIPTTAYIFAGLLVIVGILMAAFSVNVVDRSDRLAIPPEALLLLLTLVWPSFLLLRALSEGLFPLAIFTIGDGRRAPGRLAFWRNLIFGSILLAAAVNVATSLI